MIKKTFNLVYDQTETIKIGYHFPPLLGELKREEPGYERVSQFFKFIFLSFSY